MFVSRSRVCVTVFFAVGLITSSVSHAADTAATPQQERMKTCNSEAGTKKLSGDARKSFMSDCLSGKTAAGSTTAPMTAQQERMKICNAKASEQKLAGDTRKQFMSSCLKG